MTQETSTKNQAIISLSYSLVDGLEITRVLFIDSSYSSKKKKVIQGRLKESWNKYKN